MCTHENVKECRNILNIIFLSGVCSLDDRVYCIGGTYGPSGTKYCFRLNDTESKWDRIANLQQGMKKKIKMGKHQFIFFILKSII